MDRYRNYGLHPLGRDRRRTVQTNRRNERSVTMGHTDGVFKAFLRFVLDALKEAVAEPDASKQAAKLEKIIDNLQSSLED